MVDMASPSHKLSLLLACSAAAFACAVNACPGDLVHLDGVMPAASYPKVLKLDDWKQVVPGLVVKGGKVR